MSEPSGKIIYFISENKSDLILQAFDSVSEYDDIEGIWLSAREAIDLASKQDSTYIFVMSYFNGEEFEQLHKHTNYIYGPQVILYYLREAKPLPQWSTPLYSTALIKADVTVTSMSGAERDKATKSVVMLHGHYSKNLTEAVNVIVTPKVGSKKYIVGGSRNLHILLPEWLEHAWELSAKQDPLDLLSATYVDKFRTPTLHNLHICVSGLSVSERKEVADIVATHGGNYSGEMKIGHTTHLILKTPSGQKYQFAKKWKIQIVTLEWLTESVKSGYALKEEDYYLQDDNTVTKSTPTKDCVNMTREFGDISSIACAGDRSRINETNINQSLRFSKAMPPPPPKLLNSCVISMVNCSPNEVSLVSNIANRTGAGLCTELHDKISENITHVVVGTLNGSFKLATVENDMHYVTPQWLVDSEKQTQKLNELDYTVKLDDKAEEFTAIEEFNNNDEDDFPGADEKSMSVLNQYFNTPFDAESNSNMVAPKSTNNKSMLNEQSTVILPADTTEKIGLFIMKKFHFIPGISADNLNNLRGEIESKGGILAKNIREAGVDFMVYPLLIETRPSMSSKYKLVTHLWLSYCIHSDTFDESSIKSNLMYTPHVSKNLKPLTGMVIALTGYAGFDRILLDSGCKELGATVQDSFVRRDVPSKGLLACSILIADKPEGKKYQAAGLWKIPVVSRQWLEACVESGRRIECDLYLLENEEDLTRTVEEPTLPPNQSALKPVDLNRPRTDNFDDTMVNTQTPSEKFLTKGVIYRAKLKRTDQPLDLPTPEWMKNVKKDDNEASLLTEDSPMRFQFPDSTEKANKLAGNFGSGNQRQSTESMPSFSGGDPVLTEDSNAESEGSRRDLFGDIQKRYNLMLGKSMTKTTDDSNNDVMRDLQNADNGLSPEAQNIGDFMRNNTVNGHSPTAFENANSEKEEKNEFEIKWCYQGHEAPQNLNDIKSKLASRGSKSNLNASRDNSEEGEEVLRIFSFTGISQEDRDHYHSIIDDLHGEVDEDKILQENTTHLIIGMPARNEKYLMCLAKGRWVLHKSYLDACASAGRWLNERAYEWGSPGTAVLLVQLSPLPPTPSNGKRGLTTTSSDSSSRQTHQLAQAAAYWRRRQGGAFREWRVLFQPADWDKLTSFSRIIRAGGGEVGKISDGDRITHAFCKCKNGVPSVSKELLNQFQWLRIDYLCAYLTNCDDSEIDTADYLLQSSSISRQPSSKRIRQQ